MSGPVGDEKKVNEVAERAKGSPSRETEGQRCERRSPFQIVRAPKQRYCSCKTSNETQEGRERGPGLAGAKGWPEL